MTRYFYKAYDGMGGKTGGTVDAANAREADRQLRASGLRPYFIDDYALVKKAHRRKRRRQRVLIIGGSGIVGLSLIASGMIVAFAGREQAPTLEQYQALGIATAEEGPAGGKTDEAKAFAEDMHDAWSDFIPDIVRRVEVRKPYMTVHVTRRFHAVSEENEDYLISSTMQVLKRRFGARARLIIVEGELLIMEVKFNPINKTLIVKRY